MLIKAIPSLRLPVTLQVRDKDGALLGDALMDVDGTVTALWLTPNVCFQHPSALRDKLIKKNEITYSYFFYNGQSLRDHGVQ